MDMLELQYYDQTGTVRAIQREGSIKVGSGADCDLILPWCAPNQFMIYMSTQGYYAADMGGDLVINGQAGPNFVRHGDEIRAGNSAFRLGILPSMAPSPPHQPIAPQPVTPRVMKPKKTRAKKHARRSKPKMGTPAGYKFAFLFPGAGQAYNGQPIKAMFFLLTALLILPWLWSLYDAHKVGSQYRSGAREQRRGGFIWVGLHLWLTLNLALTGVIALTLTGILK